MDKLSYGQALVAIKEGKKLHLVNKEGSYDPSFKVGNFLGCYSKDSKAMPMHAAFFYFNGQERKVHIAVNPESFFIIAPEGSVAHEDKTKP